MACDLDTILDDACESGIGKLTDPVQLLKIIAQLQCEISQGGGSSGLPSGVILMWSGTIATIPSGYVLCNGSNGTPDLRNRFVVGAQQDDAGEAKTNLTGSLTVSGGSISHSHTAFVTSPSAGEFPGIAPDGSLGPDVTVNSTDAPQPYYALAFIMKT